MELLADSYFYYFIQKESDTISPEYNYMVFTTPKRNFWQNIIDPSTTLDLISKLEIPTNIFKYEIDN
jgi:hypothetical protein